MHQHLKQRARQGHIQLLFLGDSITEAMNGVNDLLQHNWGAYQPASFGIAGDTTEQLLWRLHDGELNGLQPKLVVMLIGTNNLSGDKDDDIAAGVKANVDELRRRLPASKILVLGILPRAHEAGNKVRGRIKRINGHLQSLADQKHVWFVDVGEKLVEPDGSISSAVMIDYLHPTRKGYEILFAALKPTIDKLLPSQP